MEKRYPAYRVKFPACDVALVWRARRQKFKKTLNTFTFKVADTTESFPA
jgi:hypothetical protein